MTGELSHQFREDRREPTLRLGCVPCRLKQRSLGSLIAGSRTYGAASADTRRSSPSRWLMSCQTTTSCPSATARMESRSSDSCPETTSGLSEVPTRQRWTVRAAEASCQHAADRRIEGAHFAQPPTIAGPPDNRRDVVAANVIVQALSAPIIWTRSPRLGLADHAIDRPNVQTPVLHPEGLTRMYKHRWLKVEPVDLADERQSLCRRLLPHPIEYDRRPQKSGARLRALPHNAGSRMYREPQLIAGSERLAGRRPKHTLRAVSHHGGSTFSPNTTATLRPRKRGRRIDRPPRQATTRCHDHRCADRFVGTTKLRSRPVARRLWVGPATHVVVFDGILDHDADGLAVESVTAPSGRSRMNALVDGKRPNDAGLVPSGGTY